jgi:hypothetical protein
MTGSILPEISDYQNLTIQIGYEKAYGVYL